MSFSSCLMRKTPRDDPFSQERAIVNNHFDENHPLISRVYANVNLKRGPSHYQFKGWNPKFGDIERYKLCKMVGSGRYSEVFLALQDNEVPCAIKVLKPVNTDRVRRELKILSIVQGQKNILKLKDIVIDRKNGIPAMVTDFIPNTPWRELFNKFNMDDIRFYIYRLLQALAHTHSRGVMHRDVKPLNILCKDPRKDFQLADWGLAEFYHPLHRYSVHVATRYYKAPELLVNFHTYDYSIDIWSVGVTLLEALTLKIHIFDADENEDMIDSIAAVMGPKDIFEWAEKYRIRIPKVKRDIIAKCKKVPFEKLIPSNRARFKDPIALDLVRKLLVIDHKERLTAEEALQHPFFEPVKLYEEMYASPQ
ncbi:CMGC family protein kinase [Tritrichomonas foetus]|uniref:non-specific serine/threonine protein kinase n=1 Tax=Tritrichomonas foetus TaxID=1144522 RepID=A0A1J4JLH3_9EUKA|nr:CMGC family protein kinase [Tritrichomonas foetus]|eukprot:OHS99529.1 CMGC family protein kinase [Tritrichomonas foetus]